MVTLTQVHSTNSRVATALPGDLVAVFAGATSGIGSTALLTFAKYATRPRIYFIGRNQEQGEKLTAQMKEANAHGEYVFHKTDLSLLANVDDVCKKVAAEEKAINVLFMSQGTVKMDETSEGLPYASAVSHYSRFRMASNLLPLLRDARGLRRVVSVFAGGKEGRMYMDDIPGRKVPFRDLRGHHSATMTLGLEALARQAPSVSFIHNFPGGVDTNFIRRESGLMLQMIWFFARFVQVHLMGGFMSYEECGERHGYLCVSSMYSPKGTEEGVGVEEGLTAAKGSDGETGSGVYTVDGAGDCATEDVIKLLGTYRGEGCVDKLWEHVEGEFKRITGSAAVQLD